MPLIKVRYFAALREQTGKSGEELETSVKTAADLYAELCSRYNITLAAHDVKVAINEEYQPMDSALSPGDEIVFIPPVSGG